MFIKFENEEKIKMFDEIAKHFYDSNFGRFSKADFEALMFHFYMEKMIEKHKNDDGTIDYNKCSDYKISKDLGITQQRVRNMKIKNQLLYPVDYDWKKAFAKLLYNARKEDKKIVLNIPDPNLFFEVQNFIEENGGYIEYQLNNKVLQIGSEYYIELATMLEPEENRRNIIAKLKSSANGYEKKNLKFDERHVAQSLISMGSDIASIIPNIATSISVTNLIGQALLRLFKNSG